MTLAVTGSGDLGGGRADADLALRRLDGTAGAAVLHLAFGGTPLRLALDATISEPTGAVLAALLHRDDKLPLEVKLAGDGTLDHWAGTLSLAAGAAASATARLTVTGDEPHRLSLHGSAQLAPLLPAALWPLAEGRTEISAEAAFGTAAVALDRLDIASAGAKLTTQARYAPATGAVSGSASLALADLAPLGTMIGMEIGGAGAVDVALSGTLARPSAALTLRLDHVATAQGRIAAARAAIQLDADGDPRTQPIALSGSGTIEGIAPASGPLPAGLGQQLDWSIAARIDPRQEKIAADTIEIRDAGATLAGTAAAAPDGADGELRLTVADLAPFANGALAGAGDVTATFHAASDGTATAVLAGVITNPKSATAQLDRALGARVTVAGTVRRLADGTIEARELALDGAAAQISGGAKRAPDGGLVADFAASLPRLAALDPSLAGALRATLHLEGPADALHGTAAIDAPALAANGVRIDALAARIALARLAPLDARLDAKLRLNGIDATAAAEATQSGGVLQVTRLDGQRGRRAARRQRGCRERPDRRQAARRYPRSSPVLGACRHAARRPRRVRRARRRRRATS